jgi:RecA-family ATPase
MQEGTAQPPKQHKFFNPISIREALSAPRPEIDFVIPGLPAAHLGAIVAQGGTGKGWFALQLAASQACGLPAIGGLIPAPKSPSRVVLVAAEDDATILAYRLHAVVDDLSGNGDLVAQSLARDRDEVVGLLEQNLGVVSTRGKAARIDDADETFYEELVDGCKGARLFIVDPLRRLHGGDENDSRLMTAVCERLEALCDSTGAAVLVTHHTNKHTLPTLQQAVRGSSAVTDAIRWQLNLALMSEQEAQLYAVPDDRRREYVRADLAKSNYGAPQPTRWLRRQASGVFDLVAVDQPSQSRPSKSNGGHHGRR